MLHDALLDIAGRFPANTALAHEGVELSYASFLQDVEQRAVELTRSGIKHGDRVGLLAENGIDAVVLMWAIWRCKAIAVVLNDQLKPAALQTILDDCSASMVVCQPASFASRLPEPATCAVVSLNQLSSVGAENTETQFAGINTQEASSTILDDRAKQSYANAHQNPAAGDNSIASIIYTSGSTGTPKGVCLTHRNLLSVADMAAEGYETGPDDTYLMVVPLHYIHGLMIQLALLLRGSRIEFMNSFLFPALVTRRLRDSAITGFSGVPYHFSALIDRGGFLESDLPALRWVGVTGGTIPPDRLRQLREAQPEIDIHISYGQTECSPRITLLHPGKIDSKPTSVGSVPKALTVEILDDNGQIVASEGIGELVVSGPTVMHGYWNDPEATASVIDSRGRLHTGDLAYRDADGDIFIKGRKQAMIKSVGERIFPEELEAVIHAHADVADVAVVGVLDPLYGQRVEAHVVLNGMGQEDNTSDADRVEMIGKYCLSHVPFARAPRKYHVWDAFPLKANGKTDKQRLMADRSDSTPKTPS